MANLKDISERYKKICESFIKKTVKTGLKDKGDSIFELPENYIEIALMKIIKSRGIEEVDIDCSEILAENPDKSKWVPTLVYIDTDDTLGVRWDKFLAYNTECGCIDVYEDSDTYESFFGQDEYVQTELYREVMNALGMEYVEPKMMYYQTLESFVGRVSRKRNTDLIPDVIYPDGVYILHDTLGVRTVDGWNPKDNEGVVGILVIEDDHKIVIALEDSPNKLHWSKEHKLINQQVEYGEDAESDFNGEEYCKNLNSPDFPAAYYCLNYNKDNRSWYLPSTGELKSIYRYLGEIQNALSIVGGQKFISDWNCVGMPWYWSSTESGNVHAWFFDLADGILRGREPKVSGYPKVRPISKFQSFELKESFAKKIVSRIEESFVDKIKKSSEKSLIDKSEEVFDIYLDLKKFVFENSFTFTDGWYYFDIKDFDSIPVCHEFLDDLEINDYNEYLYTYGNILLKKGKSWKDSKLMVEINKSDSSELYDDVVKTVPWDYLSDYQGEQKRIVDCLLET